MARDGHRPIWQSGPLRSRPPRTSIAAADVAMECYAMIERGTA